MSQLFLMSLGNNSDSVLSPLLGAALILALFFALSAAVYQIRLWSYTSLIGLSLGVLNLVGVAGFPWPRGPAEGAGLAALGFLLALVASRMWNEDHGKGLGILPSLWPDSPPATARRLWAEPLAEVSIFLALLGMTLVCLNWEMGSATPILATFWLSAGICALGAWMYRGPALTYVAAAALWMSVTPLLSLVGQPSIESGTALTLLGLVSWGGSFLSEKGFPALDFLEGKGETFNGQHVYKIPLARCAAIFSLLAVIQGWSWGAEWQLLLVAYLGAALVLFLAARNMHLAKRSTEAHFFVYLAGVCLGAAQVMTVSIHWDGPVLGVSTAGFSLLLACVGLVLLNNSSLAEALEQRVPTLRSVYGSPWSFCHWFSRFWLSVLF